MAQRGTKDFSPEPQPRSGWKEAAAARAGQCAGCVRVSHTGTARRAQRGAECAAAGGAGSRSCLQSKGMSGALGSTGLREGRLRKRDRYGRKEITALGRQAI